MRQLFRWLLILGVLCAVAGVVIDSAFKHLLEPELIALSARLAQEENVAAGKVVILLVGGILIVIMGVVSTVGLFKFQLWSRPLNIGTFIFALILVPFFGPSIELPVSRSLYELSMALWGAVTAMSYMEPVSAEFQAAITKRGNTGEPAK